MINSADLKGISMKKIVSLVILSCMIFSLCGCQQLEKLENIELPPLPTQTVEPVVESTPEPVIEIVADESVGAEQLQVIVNTINTTI